MKPKRAVVKSKDVTEINLVLNDEVENYHRLRQYVNDIKLHMINETNFCDVAVCYLVHQDTA